MAHKMTILEATLVIKFSQFLKAISVENYHYVSCLTLRMITVIHSTATFTNS